MSEGRYDYEKDWMREELIWAASFVRRNGLFKSAQRAEHILERLLAPVPDRGTVLPERRCEKCHEPLGESVRATWGGHKFHPECA